MEFPAIFTTSVRPMSRMMVASGLTGKTDEALVWMPFDNFILARDNTIRMAFDEESVLRFPKAPPNLKFALGIPWLE